MAQLEGSVEDLCEGWSQLVSTGLSLGGGDSDLLSGKSGGNGPLDVGTAHLNVGYMLPIRLPMM